MALQTMGRDRAPSRPGRWGVLLGLVALLAAVAVVAVGALDSGATLSSDPTALARAQAAAVRRKPRQRAGARRRRQGGPAAIHDGRLTPLAPVAAGERLMVDVTCPPARLAHLGAREHAHRAPDRLRPGRARLLALADGRARHAGPGVLRPAGQRRRVRAAPGTSRARRCPRPALVTLLAAGLPRARSRSPRPRAPGSTSSAPVRVTWFPPTTAARARSRVPAPGPSSCREPTIRLTFSRPVARCSGSSVPTLDPASPAPGGSPAPTRSCSRHPGSGCRSFHPAPLVLPRPLAVATARGGRDRLRGSRWATPTASTLRLQQLLAQPGYLPLDWRPRAPRGRARPPRRSAPRSRRRGQLQLALPEHAAASCSGCGAAGNANAITRGAVMTFESKHSLAVDGIAGPMVWHALLADVARRARHTRPTATCSCTRRCPSCSRCGAPATTVLDLAGQHRHPVAADRSAAPSRCSSTSPSAR